MGGYELLVRRWTKYGKDRLYVSTPDGVRVGWVDVRGSGRVLEAPAYARQFELAVAGWRAEHASVAVTDLAAATAGQALAEQAAARRPRRRAVRVLAGLVGWRTADYSWRVGAAGERAVGRRLERLRRRGWRVLHGVQLGQGGDVDHLLIGPAGVAVVNTKHHPRAVVQVGRKVVFVRRRPVPYVGKACREAQRTRAALVSALGWHVHVAPVIVVHGHARLAGWLRNRPEGVRVLPSWAVTWWYRVPGRAVLSPEQVEAVYAAARRPETWRSV